MKKFLLATILAAMMCTTNAFADEPEVASSVSTGDGINADVHDRTTGKKMFIKKGAHPAKQSRPLDFDITVGANWWMADVGLFLDIPIVPNGFSPLNDSFDLEIGTYAGLTWYYGGDVLSFNQDVLVGVRYSFYLNPQWTVYIRSLFGFGYYANRYTPHNDHFDAYFAWDESIGAYWNFAKNVGMRFDLGYHGLNVGIAFKFGGVGSGK